MNAETMVRFPTEVIIVLLLITDRRHRPACRSPWRDRSGNPALNAEGRRIRWLPGTIGKLMERYGGLDRGDDLQDGMGS
jgi:hypothetical protein